MEKKNKKHFLKNTYFALLAVVLLLSGGIATYAWYSSNKTVDTNRVSARTSSDNIGIQLSSDGVHFVNGSGTTGGGIGLNGNGTINPNGGQNGSGTGNGANGGQNGSGSGNGANGGQNGSGSGNGQFGNTGTVNPGATGASCSIVQINKSDLGFLMPVSTVDLKNFVTNNYTVDGMAKAFDLVKNEENYYHGRIYLRAVAENQPENSSMDIYLDEQLIAGGALISGATDELKNASRLGLTFNGESPVILRMTNNVAGASAQVRNTYIDGRLLGDDEVLSYTNGAAHASKDPSVLIDDYAVRNVNGSITLPTKPLIRLELNKVYAVDIYYYLEGCDPDCSDKVALENFDMHLAFYGVLN